MGQPMIDVPATAAADQNALSRSLRPRHVAMITIGGIIGAGLFVGSSVAIAAAGPAIIVSYALTGFLVLLIMRMLGEMAVDMPQVFKSCDHNHIYLDALYIHCESHGCGNDHVQWVRIGTGVPYLFFLAIFRLPKGS